MKHPFYLTHLARHSDIREHLGLLRGLALECEVVVELGFRTGVSTSAFLAADRPAVISYDIMPSKHAVELKKHYGNKFAFREGDSRKIEIPGCDMLFIDTDHTYATTLAELFRHALKVSRWIVLHDTKTFGSVDRGGKKSCKQGILTAVDEFLDHEDSCWRVILQINNNNGLTILERTK